MAMKGSCFNKDIPASLWGVTDRLLLSERLVITGTMDYGLKLT